MHRETNMMAISSFYLEYYVMIGYSCIMFWWAFLSNERMWVDFYIMAHGGVKESKSAEKPFVSFFRSNQQKKGRTQVGLSAATHYYCDVKPPSTTPAQHQINSG